MRDYGKVSPQFWIGKTGKSLRGDADAQIVALYLMTSPHANMIGVFYCPVMYIAAETGIPLEGASKALRRLSEAGFCTFDWDNDYVFVHEFAAHQVGESLKAEDKRCKGIENELAKVPEGQCRQGFTRRYADAFNLTKPTRKRKPLASPLEAPSKPGAETGAETGAEESSSAPQSAAKPAVVEIPLADKTNFGPTAEQIEAWAEAYPAVDVVQQLRAMREWCKSNPANRKTASGIERFVTRWLAKAQDNAKAPPLRVVGGLGQGDIYAGAL